MPSVEAADPDENTIAKLREIVIADAKAWRELFKTVSSQGMTYGRVLDKNLTTVSSGHPGGCHSYVTSGHPDSYPRYKGVYFTSCFLGDWFLKKSYAGTTMLTEELIKKYIKYLVTESPLMSLVLTPDVDFIYDNGVVLKFDKLARLFWMFKALRACTEKPQIVETWNELTEKGVQPNLALYLAYMCPVKSQGRLSLIWSGHHSIFSPAGYLDSLEAVYKGVLHPTCNGEEASSNHVFFMPSYNDYEYNRRLSNKARTSDGWGGYSDVAGVTMQELVQVGLDIEQSIINAEKQRQKVVEFASTQHVKAELVERKKRSAAA